MADRITISVDAASVLKMLDALGDQAQRVSDEQADLTAHRIAAAAARLLNSQTHGTGKTARAITTGKGEAPLGGATVFVGPTSHPANLPIWLEYGTRFMSPRPFMRPATAAEQDLHLSRLNAALEAAFRQQGLA